MRRIEFNKDAPNSRRGRTWEIHYLSEREEPLTSTLSNQPPPSRASRPATSGRRVSLGTLPDFAFPGPGVKIERVMPDTPAEAADQQAGEI